MQFPQPISAAPLPLWTPLTPAQNFRKAEKIPHAENLRRVNGSNLSPQNEQIFLEKVLPKHPTGPNPLESRLVINLWHDASLIA